LRTTQRKLSAPNKGSKMLEQNQRFIPIHWQPAILIDLFEQHQISQHELLAGSKVFWPDSETISPEQLLKVFTNAQKLMPETDMAFLYGQRALPGFFQDYSLLFQNCSDIKQAIEVIAQFYPQLSTFCIPFVIETDEFMHIQWLEPFGLDKARRFITEAFCSSIIHSFNWLAQSKLPWKVQLNLEAPENIHHYTTLLSEDIEFGRFINRLSLPKTTIDQAWPFSVKLAFDSQYKQCLDLGPIGGKSLLLTLNEFIKTQIIDPPSLEQSANYLSLSKTGLKRKLSASGVSFQKLVDRARAEYAEQKLLDEGISINSLAEQMGFFDLSNFRRAYKRWKKEFIFS
jgi:AraC-like DNA-binding protein